MKWTLLGLTQNILSALSSDEVNSIGDTVESQQVAEIIRTTYFNIITRADLPEHRRLFQLNNSLDITKPTLMTRPDQVKTINWIKYYDLDLGLSVSSSTTFIHDLNLDLHSNSHSGSSNAPSYKDVALLTVDQFLAMTSQFNTNDTSVGTFVHNNVHLKYKNNRQPSWCAIFQDQTLVFDSYDSNVDNTLKGGNTLCSGHVVPDFKMQDNFIPDMDDPQFPLLLNEAKSLAFIELKQTVHNKAEQESKRQWNSLQQTKAVINRPTSFDELPNFGRNTRGFRKL